MPDNETFEPLALRIPDAGRMIGLGHSKIWALIAAGELDARKIGARTVVTMDSLKTFLARRPAAGNRTAA